MTPIPVFAQALGRVTGLLTDLTSSHASHTASLLSLADERSSLEQKEAEIKELIEKAERKRGWFTAFREWVENVAGFLDEKVRENSFSPYLFQVDADSFLVPTARKTGRRAHITITRAV